MNIRKHFYIRKCFAVPGSQLFLDFYQSEAIRIATLFHAQEDLSYEEQITAINNIKIARQLGLPKKERRRFKSRRRNCC